MAPNTALLEAEMDALFANFDAACDAVATTLSNRARLRALARISENQAPALDSLTRIGAVAYCVPTTLITYLDPSTSRYLSTCGYDLSATDPAQQSMCKYVVHMDEVVAIGDLGERQFLSPRGVELGVAAYIGAPWHIDGHVMGTFCVLDVEKRDWEEHDIDLVRSFADEVSRLVVTR